MQIVMTDNLPKNTTLQLRVPATPENTNTGGDIFGGWIMGQVDIAGSIPAVNCSRGRVVTVAVKNFIFHKPVFAGDMVNIYADIIRIGRTSITVSAEVYVERNPRTPEVVKVAEATVVYVAVDDAGRPRPVKE